MRFIARTLMVFALLSSAPALAEEEPPTRVGRVSFISGTLAFYQSGEANWSAAKVNLPAATGGWFATDSQSRAEIRIGPDTIDIAEDSELDIADLRDRVIQFGIEHGRINLHLRELTEGANAEIDIPRGGVWLLQPGIYDIETGAADRSTRITAFDGSARFVGGGVDLTIKAGDTLVLSGSDTPSAAVERAFPDAFAKWCRSRDYDEHRLASSHRVSPGMTGFEELAAYGSWDTIPDYGAVWYPNSVPADWAPYRDGHWVWIEPWGWNWVDAEPWGFAPCHYGRWARINNHWGWVPGNFVPEPVYAPALVAFIAAPGIAAPAPVDIGPAVGWFPLAPGEVYWPSYTRNPTYIENVNIANVSATMINNVTKIVTAQRSADPPPQAVSQQFVNRSAATVVPMKVMAASAAVAPAALTVRPQAVQQASVSVRPPQVRPVTAGQTPPASTASVPNAPAPVPGHRPAPPNFSQLAPAPSGGRAPAALAQQPAPTTPAASAPIPQGPSPAARQPASAMLAAPAPGHPPSPPNFSHLAPATAAHEKPVTPPPAPGAQGTVSPPGAPGPSRNAGQAVQAAPGASRAPASVPPPSVGQEPPPQTMRPPQAAEQERQRAAQQQAQQRAAQQQAQQRADEQRAQQHAAQQQAQQQAQQHAAQQQAQQRAAQQQAQQHAAQQQAQQRAAGPKQQAQAPATCGHPGQQACPR